MSKQSNQRYRKELEKKNVTASNDESNISDSNHMIHCDVKNDSQEAKETSTSTSMEK